jgi:pyridinium-3,5-bisthiocarboxylic acid mononucleotide nickel chelatase
MSNRILYLEASMGISGDMLLGAFLDLGVPVEVLKEAWDAIEIDDYEVQISETQKSGMRALFCRVRTEESKGPRTWKQYQALLNGSKLPGSLRKTALSLCKKLFELEAGIHRTTLDKLRLHEMGGTDLLIDVVGTLAAVESLQPVRIVASPVNTGRGFIRFSHGKYPVPAPVSVSLLTGVPVFQNEVEGELATPTGILLLTHLASEFGPMPAMTLERAGAGAGEREVRDHPNVLRAFLGKRNPTHQSTAAEDDVYLMETNIDDGNPQILAYFMEKAFAQGALDVFFSPIMMKKNRPAIRLSVLLPKAVLEPVSRLLFAETTAIGLRYWKVERMKLDRKWVEVTVGKHTIRIKESYREGTLFNYQPEFEDCKAAAEKTKQPLKEMIAQAIHAYLNRRGPDAKAIRKGRKD